MPPERQAPETPKTPMTIPIAIVVGFTFVAIAIFFGNFGGASSNATATTDANNPSTAEGGSAIAAVTSDDYIRGNPNAPIKFIEYADYDCEFCNRFHETMKRVMSEYGSTGDVAWVFRQFPMSDLHPNAPRIAAAALCVGEVGGQDAFWTFTDRIFAERNLDEQTSMSQLPQYAEAAGVSRTNFTNCLNSGRKQDEVQAGLSQARDAGVNSTPHTVVTVGGQSAVISGAQPYATVKSIIEDLRGQLRGGEATNGSNLPNASTTNPMTQ